LVWVVFLYFVISGGAGLIIQLEMLSGLARFPPETQALFGSLSTSTMLFSFAAGVLHLVAATSLWLLRRVALPLFSLSLLLTIGALAWQLRPGGMFAKILAQSGAMAFGAILSAGFAILTMGAIWWYTLYLWRRGVLR
jgi:hypothetical protein